MLLLLYCLLSLGVSWGQELGATEESDPKLLHTLTVRRQGRTLVLQYALRDSEGEAHDVRKVTEERPRFDIYRGGTKLAGGQFEFG